MFLKTSYGHLDGKGCWMTVRDTLPPRLPGPISLLEVAHRRLDLCCVTSHQRSPLAVAGDGAGRERV